MWLLVLCLALPVVCALVYAGVGRIARALFDSPPTPAPLPPDRDETAPADDLPGEWVHGPVIPVTGRGFVVSMQVSMSPSGTQIITYEMSSAALTVTVPDTTTPGDRR